MLRMCGLCAYFERMGEMPKPFGNCYAGHKTAQNNVTFSTNTCDHFVHKRYMPKDIILLQKRRMEKDGTI